MRNNLIEIKKNKDNKDNKIIMYDYHENQLDQL